MSATGETDRGGSAKSRTRRLGGDLKHLLLGALLGAGLYVVLLGVSAIWPGTRPFADKFVHRGWTPYVAVLLSGWCVSLFIEKRGRLRRRQRLLAEAYLPQDALLDTDDEIQEEVVRVRTWAKASGDTILGPRIQRLLEHFIVSRNAREVSEVLREETDAELADVHNSYTLARVFLWAIPILGFIGTVVGVGDAVGGFARFLQTAQEIDEIKTALTGVTNGLSVAFDTTLVALLLSIIVMVLLSAIERSEQAQAQAFEDYCMTRIVQRLPKHVEGRGEGVTKEMAAAIREVAAQMAPGNEAWERRDQVLAKKLGESMERAWLAAGERWADEFRRAEGTWRRDSHQQQTALDKVAEEAASLRQTIGALLPQMQALLESGQGSLVRSLSTEQAAISEAVNKQHDMVQQYTGALLRASGKLEELAKLRVELEQGLVHAAGSDGIAAALKDLRHALAELDPALRRFAEKPIDVEVRLTAGPPVIAGH